MLSQPPYSLVNLTENLLPLNLDSTYEDLLALIEQYQTSAESRQILELTLKNLQGGLDTPAYGQKWVMINTNQIWAKKLTNLIEEVAEEEPEVFEKFKSLEWLQMDVFKEILNFNEAWRRFLTLLIELVKVKLSYFLYKLMYNIICFTYL